MPFPKSYRVLIILYAGDYHAAYNRMKNSLGEAYHHHNYALNSIAEFAKKDNIEEIAVLGCSTAEAYNHFLEIGFRVIGAGLNPYKNPRIINKIIKDYNPTHIVLRTPITSILRWAVRNNVRTITLLADSFNKDSLMFKLKVFWLTKLLNNKVVEWVGNHHINSCDSLKKIGVSPNKIVPWDWPRENVTPENFEPKSLDINQSSFRFIYVGSIYEGKGVGDIIDAMPILKSLGIHGVLEIFGRRKNIDSFEQKINRLGIEDSVRFSGFVPNEEVVHLMRKADVVLIPSRHYYGEGMPSTIYEALCARTPIVASDHPMFLRNIEDEYSALIFPERQPRLIAQCVQRLLQDPELYFKLSENSYDAWQKLQIPVKWADFISHWIEDTPDSHRWISDRCLSSKTYVDRLHPY